MHTLLSLLHQMHYWFWLFHLSHPISVSVSTISNHLTGKLGRTYHIYALFICFSGENFRNLNACERLLIFQQFIHFSWNRLFASGSHSNYSLWMLYSFVFIYLVLVRLARKKKQLPFCMLWTIGLCTAFSLSTWTAAIRRRANVMHIFMRGHG